MGSTKVKVPQYDASKNPTVDAQCVRFTKMRSVTVITENIAYSCRRLQKLPEIVIVTQLCIRDRRYGTGSREINVGKIIEQKKHIT